MSNEVRQPDPSPRTARDLSPATHHSGVALVTGAGQGLGQALTLHLAAAGYSVAAADVRKEGALETARMAAEQHRVRTLGLRADVTSEEDVTALFRRTESELGPVELIVAN